MKSILQLWIATLAEAFRGPWRWREILNHIVENGIGSLPIVVVSTAFAGLVISNEIAWHLNRALHTFSMIPGVTGQFILREIGTAIPALLLVSRVGAAIAAEVGSMRVTDQISALKLLGINPVSYIVFPRFIASIISTACLTIISVFVTLACAIGVAVFRYGFSVLEYINTLRHFIGYADLFSGLCKGLVFGAVIPIISCAYGLRCENSAAGVGEATTQAVVGSTVAIIVLDFILNLIFSGSLGA
jgi:phospholipid/cholesterol/gamma-HCH transport system permease protein